MYTTTSAIRLSRPAAQGIAVGLILMAVFTAMWANWALSSAEDPLAPILCIIFTAVALFFAANAIHLFASLRKFRKATSDAEIVASRAIGKRFNVIFGLEAGVACVVCAALAITSQYQFIAPAVALVVGLHSFPIAQLFQRRLDIWLGTTTILFAIGGLVAIGLDRESYLMVWEIVGFATATITTIYGVAMLVAKHGALGQFGSTS
ncbi:MAG: hypothetical protein JWQ12_1640 [Glaciihabitans sp.]|jgi:hypothetical protein|nr:hypothetical protein [Glaciihabitans sp.]